MRTTIRRECFMPVSRHRTAMNRICRAASAACQFAGGDRARARIEPRKRSAPGSRLPGVLPRVESAKVAPITFGNGAAIAKGVAQSFPSHPVFGFRRNGDDATLRALRRVLHRAPTLQAVFANDSNQVRGRKAAASPRHPSSPNQAGIGRNFSTVGE